MYYNRVDLSEGVYFNKASASKKDLICHYWYFIDIRYTFQQFVGNGCHNALLALLVLF